MRTFFVTNWRGQPLKMSTVFSKLGILMLFNVHVMSMQPTFRIVAPEFICPEDYKSAPRQLDDVVITVETNPNALFKLNWTVRWVPVPSPSQRFTLMLWKSVRAIEAKLKSMQPDSQVYFIHNEELLSDVVYIFNVTAIEINEDVEIQETFYIEKLKSGLLHADESKIFFIKLLGSKVTYTDLRYVVEAQVTTCLRSQDYYFSWSVVSIGTEIEVNVTDTIGSRLEIDAYSLIPGLSYNVTCLLINSPNGGLINDESLSFEVLYRGLEIYLSIDVITVPIDSSFQLDTIVVNHDYVNESPHYEWQCKYEEDRCEYFDSVNNGTLIFPYGLPKAGRYEVTVIATVRDQTSVSICTIIAVTYAPAIFEVKPVPRKLNENSVVYLTATVINVSAPSTFTWYFANRIDIMTSAVNTSCEECLYGKAISDTLIVNITEENLVMNMEDFNMTDSWQIEAKLTAEAGTAKFVVKYYCFTIECSEDIFYSNIKFTLNASPQIGNIMVLPETGTAMETIFIISARPAMDIDKPLRYTFYCKVGNETLTLGSYMDHLSVNTYLPYFDGGVFIWVEVCDSLEACSTSEMKSIEILPSTNSILDSIMENIEYYITHCDLVYLRRIVLSTIITYKNQGDAETLSIFTSALIKLLPSEEHCIKRDYEKYYDLLYWMVTVGGDVNHLML